MCSTHAGIGCEPGSHPQTRPAAAVASRALLAGVLTCLHLEAGLPGALLGPGASGDLGEWS